MNGKDLKEMLFGGRTDPEWGIVLGTGFDEWMRHLSCGPRVPFGEVDGVTPATVPGHRGFFASGSVEGRPVVVAAGRLHLYEGLTAREVAAPVRVMHSLGISRALLTCAVGALGQNLNPGDAVVITDQINLTGEDPHTGTGAFPDASGLYHGASVKYLGRKGLKEAVLAGVRGPSYETPAEVRALKMQGADVVCMSTVLEALALAGQGVQCVGVGIVANPAGVGGLRHEEVLRSAARSAKTLWPAVRDLISSSPG